MKVDVWQPDNRDSGKKQHIDVNNPVYLVQERRNFNEYRWSYVCLALTYRCDNHL